MIKIKGTLRYLKIKRTPKLVQEIKEQIQWQTKMGYTHGVEANTKWLETGLGIPVHGIPPTNFGEVSMNTPVCRGFNPETRELCYLEETT
jgi:hypothetical protein